MKIVIKQAKTVDTDNFRLMKEWKDLLDDLLDSMNYGMRIDAHVEIMEYLRTKSAHKYSDLLALRKLQRRNNGK